MTTRLTAKSHYFFLSFLHLFCVFYCPLFPPKNSNNILSSLYPSQTDWMEIREKSDLRKSPWESSFETSQTHPSLITNIFARQSNLPRNYLRQQDVFSRWHLWLDDMRERAKNTASASICAKTRTFSAAWSRVIKTPDFHVKNLFLRIVDDRHPLGAKVNTGEGRNPELFRGYKYKYCWWHWHVQIQIKIRK